MKINFNSQFDRDRNAFPRGRFEFPLLDCINRLCIKISIEAINYLGTSHRSVLCDYNFQYC